MERRGLDSCSCAAARTKMSEREEVKYILLR